MNALKFSMRNEVPENRHIKIKFCNKKCSVEKTQIDQNVSANGFEKLTKHTRLNYMNRRSIKLTVAGPISKFFAG